MRKKPLATVIILLVFITNIIHAEQLLPLWSVFSDTDELKQTLTHRGIDGLKVTEVGFDGNDERIEITNYSSQTTYEKVILSGVKSKVITLTNLTLDYGESIIVGDSLSNVLSLEISGQMLTGLGLSISDSTGFSVGLYDGYLTELDKVTFDASMIQSIPDGLTLSRYFAEEGGDLIDNRYTSAGDPRVVHYAFSEGDDDAGTDLGVDQEIVPEEPNGEDEIEDTNGSGDILEDDGNHQDENNQNQSPTEQTQSDGADQGNANQGSGNQGEGDSTNLPSSTTGDMQSSTGGTTGPTTSSTGSTNTTTSSSSTSVHSLQSTTGECYMSEIHSVSDTYPEYVEMYCSDFEGKLTFVGLGAGTTVKTIHISVSSGTHFVLASTHIGLEMVQNLVLITGMSLLDAGETLTYSGTSQGVMSVTYPATGKGNSYYPQCTAGVCLKIASSTPGENILYVDNSVLLGISATGDGQYVFTTDSPLQLIETPIDQNTSSTTAKTTTTKTTTTKPTSTKSTKDTKTTTSKTASSKATTTSKTDTKSTTKSTTAKAATTKSTTTKSTSTKTTKTKAQILLENEHTIYKNYVDFLQKYLKSHLYTSYTDLKIPQIQDLLKKSLQTAKKNNTILTYSGGKTISIFDFGAQWSQTQTGQSLENAFSDMYSQGQLLFKVAKRIHNTVMLLPVRKKLNTGVLVKNQSQSDTSKDIIDIKTSEMSYLH